MTMSFPTLAVRLTLGASLALTLAACASTAPQGVAAVVEDEGARQAAAQSAQTGAGSDAALKQGAEAAATNPGEREPPTR